MFSLPQVTFIKQEALEKAREIKVKVGGALRTLNGVTAG